MKTFINNELKNIAISIIILVILGCICQTTANAMIIGDSKEVKTAIHMIKEYKTKLYNIPNYSKFRIAPANQFIAYLNKEFKPYFTDNGLSKFMNNRIPIMYGEASVNSKLTMKLKSISFDKITADKKTNELVIDYTTIIELNAINGKISFKEFGQIIIKKQSNRLLIDNDWISVSKKLMKLAVPKK